MIKKFIKQCEKINYTFEYDFEEFIKASVTKRCITIADRTDTAISIDENMLIVWLGGSGYNDCVELRIDMKKIVKKEINNVLKNAGNDNGENLIKFSYMLESLARLIKTKMRHDAKK